jgi:hypothetical protein
MTALVIWIIGYLFTAGMTGEYAFFDWPYKLGEFFR